MLSWAQVCFYLASTFFPLWLGCITILVSCDRTFAQSLRRSITWSGVIGVKSACVATKKDSTQRSVSWRGSCRYPSFYLFLFCILNWHYKDFFHWNFRLLSPWKASSYRVALTTPLFNRYCHWWKSSWVDNIPAELAQAGGEVTTALSTICNRICQTGEWPTPWTQSLVITLPKKSNLQQCQNYQTISFISHPNIVLLKVILQAKIIA